MGIILRIRSDILALETIESTGNTALIRRVMIR
jgi:hypothetical protein